MLDSSERSEAKLSTTREGNNIILNNISFNYFKSPL